MLLLFLFSESFLVNSKHSCSLLHVQCSYLSSHCLICLLNRSYIQKRVQSSATQKQSKHTQTPTKKSTPILSFASIKQGPDSKITQRPICKSSRSLRSRHQASCLTVYACRFQQFGMNRNIKSSLCVIFTRSN